MLRRDLLKGGLSALLTTSAPFSALAMGPPYRPLADCLALADKDDKDRLERMQQIGSMWVTEAVQLIVGLAYAYDAIRDNRGNSDAMLREVNLKLDEIQRTLQEVNRKIDQVMLLIIQLPAILRGIVNNALVQQALGKANFYLGEINDKLKTSIFDQNIDTVDALTRSLGAELGGIVGLRGASGVLITAPYISAWLAASTAVQKGRKRRNPSHIIESPWEKSFMLQQRSLFADFFTQAEVVDGQYQAQVIPKEMPKHYRFYEVRGGLFQTPAGPVPPFPPPGTWPPGLPPIQFYNIACPSGLAPERLQKGKREIQSSDPAHIDAFNAWRTVLEKRTEMESFYTLVPDLYSAKSKLMDVFVEPAGMWDVNN